MEKWIAVMKRTEMKYVLTKEQVAYLRVALTPHMKVDRYGLTSIASLYFDTMDYRLIRESIEKPSFKEKIRLRSYGLAKEGSPVYLELKRKAEGVVYKRRVETSIDAVNAFFAYEGDVPSNGQIAREISYFRDYYGKLVPTCLIIYDRVAYEKEGDSLRLTIDFNPRYRLDDLDLTSSLDGIPLLREGEAILEIKVQEAMPLWLSKILDEGKIYQNSFSKYGAAYQAQLINFVPLMKERRPQTWKPYSKAYSPRP